MKKHILLSFDIEEFDMPLEFGNEISEKEQFEISREGTQRIKEILDKLAVKATLFTTTSFALKYPKLIREMGIKNEIAFHGNSHKDNYSMLGEKEILSKLKSGKSKLEKTAGKKVYGFRAQRLQKINPEFLKRAGIIYDSSLHPTYIPGRYNNFFSSRKIRKLAGVVEIPLSVTPVVRLPLFWLAFRNLGKNYSRLCSRACLLDSDYVMLYFHPWEFVNLNEYDLRLPGYIKRNSGENLARMIGDYVAWGKKRGNKFSTTIEFLKENKII